MKTTLIALFLLAGCAVQPKLEPDNTAVQQAFPPAANQMRVGFAPTPFSADQIAAACIAGASRTHRQVANGMTGLTRMTFQESVGDSVTVEVANLDDAGEILSRQMGPSTPWTALQAHASFPVDKTVITRRTVTTQAATFDCWTYTVSLDDGVIQEYSFAINLPGPPVLFIQTKDGQELFSMELTDYN